MCSTYLDFLMTLYEKQEPELSNDYYAMRAIITNIISNVNITYNEALRYKDFLEQRLNNTYNPNWTTIDFIRLHKDDNLWNWDFLTSSVIHDLGFDVIINNPDLPWKLTNSVLILDYIPIKYIIDNPTLGWNWNHIYYYSSNITIDIINDNPNLPWKYDRLINNFDDSRDYSGIHKILSKYIYWIIENGDLYSKIDPILTTKKNVWERIKDNIFVNDYMDMDKLSKDPNLTFNIINKYPTLKWNGKHVYNNPNINRQEFMKSNLAQKILSNALLPDILANLQYNWEWTDISKSSLITMDDITNNPTLPWNWKYICCNPNLTFDFVQQNLSEELCWGMISKHKNITMEHVIQHPEYPWDYITLAVNPNLTIDFVLQNQDKDWALYSLLMAKFTYSCDIYNKTVKNTILNTPLCIQNLTKNIIEFI